MKTIIIHYNDFTKKYVIDYSPHLGKKRRTFENLESLLEDLKQNIERPKRKMRVLLSGAFFPEGGNEIKKRISDLFPKAIYEIPKENKQKTREEVYSQ